MHIERLTSEQIERAKALFALITEVLEERGSSAGEDYIERLLSLSSFWAVAAVHDNAVVGGLTGHLLPMTKAEQSELLIYDVAVGFNFQRQGIGQMLVGWVRREASALGIGSVFVLADNEDVHAIDFYRKAGGADSPVTLFAWTG